MMTLPTGAPSAVMSKKTLTVAIVLRMGWIRVDSEDASVELLEGRGRVKPAERPRLAERWNSDPRGKRGAKAGNSRAGPRAPGRSNIAGRGPRAGPHSYLGKLMQEKLFPLSNGSDTMLWSNPDCHPQLPGREWISLVEKCLELFGRITTWLHQWKQSTLLSSLPTPPSRKILDFGKWQHVSHFKRKLQMETHSKSSLFKR